MWNLPKGNEFLPKTTLGELETLYAAEKKAKPKTGCCAPFTEKKAQVSMILQK